jgi:integrase
MLPGVHKVRVKLAGGPAEYWYAWRGGPRILTLRGRSDADLERLAQERFSEAAAAYRKAVAPQRADEFLSGLCVKYEESAEFKKLAPRTRADLKRHLSVVRNDIGVMALEALKSDGARKALLDWRDRYKSTPKTADAYLGALALVLSWAKKRGDLATNPLEKWPRLYSVNRAEAIWTKPDLIKLLKGVKPEFRRAVLLAAFTGLRLGDLVRLSWADVGQDAITLATAKSKGKRVVVIPITPKTRAILKQIGRKDVGAVLTHSGGKPWTGWGLQTAMQRAKVDRGIKGLRFHDLRGTAATHFARHLPLADVARIMGWTPQRVDAIAARYVTAEAVAAGMLKRLGKNKSGAVL